MEKLTAEQAARTPMLRGRTTRVHAALTQLEVGEGLIIRKKTDWISKSPPYRIVNAFAKKHNRKFNKGRTPDESGWMVVRTA